MKHIALIKSSLNILKVISFSFPASIDSGHNSSNISLDRFRLDSPELPSESLKPESCLFMNLVIAILIWI